MTVVIPSLPVEPAWRVKTRPCEAHLRGHCLFGADKCNFLHIDPHALDSEPVSPSTIPETTNTITTQPTESRIQSGGNIDYSEVKKSVMGELKKRNKREKRSSSSSSSSNKVLSPQRSPRRASLLLALKGIISDDEEGDNDEDEDDDDEEQEDFEPATVITATIRPPPIDISSPYSPPPDNDNDEDNDNDNDNDISNETLGSIDLRRFSQTSHISTLSALSSSLGLSQFPMPPSWAAHDEDGYLNDSGFYDSTKPSPSPLPLSPPPPRSTLDMLNSPFGSPSSRLNSGFISPGLGGSFAQFMNQSPAASAHGQEEPETGNDSSDSLDSPTVYYRKREAEDMKEDELNTLERRRDGEEGSSAQGGNESLESQGWGLKDMDIKRPEEQAQFDDADSDPNSPSTPRSFFEDDDDDDDFVDQDEDEEGEDDEEELEDEPPSSGHTSLWDDAQRNDETVVYLGQRKSTQRLEFVEEELQGCSSFAGEHPMEDDEEEDYDETARLAYLDQENDTLNSLYEVYSDIGSDAGDPPTADDLRSLDPERPYTPAGIPLPSPTHSEVHAYALLELFHKQEKVSPMDAWVYEPDESFSTRSSQRLSNLHQQPVPIPFLRERVFTPPPPSPPTPSDLPVPPLPDPPHSLFERVFTPPPSAPTEVPLPPVPQHQKTPSTSSSSSQTQQTPPQPATRPTTPRSAPAATAVYEKDKRRTSTMVEPDTPMPPKRGSWKREQEMNEEESKENREDEDGKEEESGETKVLKRGLKPLRLSTLLLSNPDIDSPLLTGTGSVFSAGSRSTSHIAASTPTSALLSPSHGQVFTTPVLSQQSPSAPAILDSELSLFNNVSSSSSPLSLSPQLSQQPLPLSQPHRTSTFSHSSRPPSLLPSHAHSYPQPRPGSAGPQRRQSRIRYIRHNPDTDVPQSAPPSGTWDSRQLSQTGDATSEKEVLRNRLSYVRNSSPHSQAPQPIRVSTPSQRSSMSRSQSQVHSLSGRRPGPSSITSPQDEERSVQSNSNPPIPASATATTTPRPELLFAIASDDPDEVERVLEVDNSTAVANDAIGPQSQSALEFVLTNEGLKNKLDIVKVLLGHGADPLKVAATGIEDEATRYYLSLAGSSTTKKTAALMARSSFRQLGRMRYGIVGQDRALEQLFRVLSMHSVSGGKSGSGSAPIVVFLCGPSGHGKSLLAHQFGSLLDVPIHTVNMTTLRSADDLWKSYSISSTENTAPCTLVEFLANNEGKRCVVVLDEIEKTEDAKALWSLLVPWELGRCTFEANSRTIDVRNVIWVGTSNIGQDVIFSYHESRANPEEAFTRAEYLELMGTLRPQVSERLGTSVLSRVSAILPFVPFTEEERRVIASEMVARKEGESEVVRELVKSQGMEPLEEKRWRERIVDGAVGEYILVEVPGRWIGRWRAI